MLSDIAPWVGTVGGTLSVLISAWTVWRHRRRNPERRARATWGPWKEISVRGHERRTP